MIPTTIATAWQWTTSIWEPAGWALTVLALAIITGWWLPFTWPARRRVLAPCVTYAVIALAIGTWSLEERAANAVALAQAPTTRIIWRGDVLWLLGAPDGGALVHGLLGSTRTTRIQPIAVARPLTRRQALALARTLRTPAPWMDELRH